jgi:hypothetical protein
MIFVKSSFNPNLTYVKEFSSGALLQSSLPDNDTTDYQVGSQTVTMSRYYIFNTQIPSMLGRLAMNGNFS